MAMKIKPEHVEYMRTEMMKIRLPHTLADYTSRGLTEKRWRWDWCDRAGLITWICDNIYPYANDEHIDTALRHITSGK